jgi:hypothetical protein
MTILGILRRAHRENTSAKGILNVSVALSR